MGPDPIPHKPAQTNCPFESASVVSDYAIEAGYSQPISYASIQAAEQVYSLLQRVASELAPRLAPDQCLVAFEPNEQTKELYSLIVGREQESIKVALQRSQSVLIIRSISEIETFDDRQAKLRSLRDLHILEPFSTHQREDLREDFVRLGSLDLNGRPFRAQVGAITDPVSPWSELTVLFAPIDSQRATVAVSRSDPHKTVTPQIVEFGLLDGRIVGSQISFGGSPLSTQSAIYRPQLQSLCERELPRLCSWVEDVLAREEPWVRVSRPFSDFL